jgi:hypothetical protein
MEPDDMRHVSETDYPSYVSDRLSAVRHVPLQILVSIGLVALILIPATLADVLSTSDGAGEVVDAQQTVSIDVAALKFAIGDRGRHCHLSRFP